MAIIWFTSSLPSRGPDKSSQSIVGQSKISNGNRTEHRVQFGLLSLQVINKIEEIQFTFMGDNYRQNWRTLSPITNLL